MTGSLGSSSRSPADAYSPQFRTALILTGTGTAGAYHAGVLRALHEAGIKIDLVGGHGIGVVGALFAAVDGDQHLWGERGFWRSAAVRGLYPWQPIVRVAVWAFALSVAVVIVPIATVALGLFVYPIDFVLKMVTVRGASDLVEWYLRFAQAAFSPEALPTWLPRIVVLALGSVATVALVTGWMNGGPRRQRGPFWWRMVRPPLSSAEAADRCWAVMWRLLRGASLKQPTSRELALRYIDLAAENLGQPGFRELVLVVHDVDAHHDLVFALVAESGRRHLIRRPTTHASEARRAEVFDLGGLAREYLADVVAGALTIPVASEPTVLTFASDAFWRGETHRVCDRPAIVARVLEEMVELGAEQLIVVSAAAERRAPHTLAPPRLDGRGRLGDYLQSSEAAALRDCTRAAESRGLHLFTIQPGHNPIGPFDFADGFDDRSDRRQGLDELMARGYEDAYRQFIEPVVGASGEVLD
ncbi:MAG: hypothetical protein C5B57_08630 [Blastocatellia bacterium]|nr:MAG: hypothetical protein C5B57_08630 [Blastocatellia bacterium]